MDGGQSAAAPRKTRRASPTTTTVRIHGRTVEIPIAELWPSPEQQESEARERAFRYALAHRALNALSGKQYDVVYRHYGFHMGHPMPFDEVADDLGMSLSSAYVHHHRAIKAMREALGVRRGQR